LADYSQARATDQHEFARAVETLMQNEAALHLDDLLLRRTDWASNPRQLSRTASSVMGRLGWSSDRRRTEWQRCDTIAFRTHEVSEVA
jgi:glycerol-3-phosphate dehydrogenase